VQEAQEKVEQAALMPEDISHLVKRFQALQKQVADFRIIGAGDLDVQGSFEHGFAVNASGSAAGGGGTTSVVGAWVWGAVGKLWPDEIDSPSPSYISWASDNAGWWWHHHCVRILKYQRTVADGTLSGRTVIDFGRSAHSSGAGFNFFGDFLPSEPEFFESLPTTTNWYNPSEADVTQMLTYIDDPSPAGTPTATQEVLISIDMFRERQWTNPDFPTDGIWSGWTTRLDEATGSWPFITQIAFRYV
jgi:hypothetical protein